MNICLVIGFIAAASAAPADMPEPALGTTNAVVDYQSDVPPPTRYDAEQHTTPMDAQTRSLTWQLLRTVIALGFVIALIFLIAKVAMPRLTRLAGVKGTGRIKVLERMPLDAKTALYLLELDGKEQILIAATGQNVKVLTSSREAGHE